MDPVLDKILSYAIPLAAVILSYILGRLQTRRSEKRQAQKERYEQFYVPFITLLYGAGSLRYSELDFKAQCQYHDLLFLKVQYIDEQTQSLLPTYNDAFYEALEDPSGACQLDDSFTAIRNSVLSEAQTLSKSLHLPPLGQSLCQAAPHPRG